VLLRVRGPQGQLSRGERVMAQDGELNGIPYSVGIMFSQMVENPKNVVLIAGQDKTTGKKRFFVFRAVDRGPDNMTGLALLAEMLPADHDQAMRVMTETRPHPESSLDETEWAFGGPDIPDVFRS